MQDTPNNTKTTHIVALLMAVCTSSRVSRQVEQQRQKRRCHGRRESWTAEVEGRETAET